MWFSPRFRSLARAVIVIADRTAYAQGPPSEQAMTEPAATEPAADPVEIAIDLIRRRSVTPADDGALTVVAARLAAAGFRCETLRFAEPDFPAIDNLFAIRGAGRPCFVFAGHTDVVPPGLEASWSAPPFAAELRDGMLWGRGAADMKGGVAASMAAALRFVADHPDHPGSIAFLITGDEEGPAVNGTVKLLAWAQAEGHVFDHCLLAEPTNPHRLGEMIKIGRRGSLTGHVRVRGRQGHVAYPHLADNPAPVIAAIVLGLKAAPLDAGTAHFAPSNVEVTTIDIGNKAGNVIAAEARASFNIRFNDLWSPASLEAEIRSRIAAAAPAAAVDVTVDPTNAVAFLTEPGPFSAMLAKAIEAETGLQPVFSTTGGTSDARFIKDYCEVIEFGLVGQTMHQVDERIAIADLEALTRILHRLLEAYFAAHRPTA
jgi:succinyl-diaminopimelate desuccinylase